MAGGLYDSSLTRVRPFFQTLVERDPTGRSWLPALLAATPNARQLLGEIVDSPGWLIAPLSTPTPSGWLACFQYPVAPPRELLGWFIDHPEALRWPADASLSREAVLLRRALLYDDPPGSQEKAQDRARELLVTRSPFSDSWWRFEGVTRLDCVLITDRVVVAVEGTSADPVASGTRWYPHRTQLVRTLEAAKQIATSELGAKQRWASLLLSEHPVAEGSDEHLAQALAKAAPHLSAAERDALHESFLGNITWEAACQAVGLPPNMLPETVRIG